MNAATAITRKATLAEILAHKKDEVAAIRGGRGIDVIEAAFAAKIRIAAPPLDFVGAIRGKKVNVIAEVKKASPSKGVIREDFDPVSIARIYEGAGAAAISVLTDEKYFMGSLENLSRIRKESRLPLLRKDFIIDPVQAYEARAEGADAALLIAAALGKGELTALKGVITSLGMAALVEVHTEKEFDAAVDAGATLIGINNRDLNTFKTDISTTVRIAKMAPKGVTLVSESGINTADDIKRIMGESGVKAFLVGEALMREKDIASKLSELLGAA